MKKNTASPTDAGFDKTAYQREYMRKRRAGEQPASIRIDADIAAAWKATGPDWQSRLNDALRKISP
jgi:uncharacterized protein (DUF4415 family)